MGTPYLERRSLYWNGAQDPTDGLSGKSRNIAYDT